ncbi:MAG: flagellar protein FlgN [Betaproteobacteria bacterium]
MVSAGHSESGTIFQSLKSELEAVQRFVSLLKTEQTLLSSGDTEELPELLEQKNHIANQLSQYAEHRNSLLSAQGLGSDRSGIETWCAKHPKEMKAAETWEEIITLAGEARELNRVNGELIALRMQYNTNALEALRGGNNSLNLYGPDGQSTFLGSRRINDAV